MTQPPAPNDLPDDLHDDLAGNLQRHIAALAKLQGEFAASRLEVAGARGETVQFQGFLHRARVEAAAAHAHIDELRVHAARREVEITRLQTEIGTFHTDLAALRQRIETLYASSSWRVSAPLRVTVRAVSRLLRRP